MVNERMSQAERVKIPKKRRKYQDGLLKNEGKAKHRCGAKDTEEMKRWRSLNQSEMDLCWKKLVERMEGEVLDKYKVEESKRGAFKGRGDPLEWRRVCKNKI